MGCHSSLSTACTFAFVTFGTQLNNYRVIKIVKIDSKTVIKIVKTDSKTAIVIFWPLVLPFLRKPILVQQSAVS